MNTVMILLAQYSGQAVIPVATVARDYFGLTADKFRRKLATGDIGLSVIRMTDSNKAACGIHVADLADYIDKARETARR